MGIFPLVLGPWCQTPPQRSQQPVIFAPVQPNGSAQLPYILCYVFKGGPVCLWVLLSSWPLRCFALMSGAVKLHIWKFPPRPWNLSPSLLEILLSNISLETGSVILEVVLIIPFIHFFPEINRCSLLDLFFFSYKYVHHNYGFGCESLKSLCCGNIFFNSVPCVVSSLFT